MACSLRAVCKTFLNILNEEASKHAFFSRVTGHCITCKYALFPCSFICMPFWLNELLFFFSWKFTVSFLVVFCSVTVACFSASFNVLTGILLQLKRLYFKNSISWDFYKCNAQTYTCSLECRLHFSLISTDILIRTSLCVLIVYLQHSWPMLVCQESLEEVYE